MLCKKCGAELPANARYCPRCGLDQAAEPKRKKRGNGQGTIFRRGKSWYAQVTLYQYICDGKVCQKRRTKGGFATKKEAIEYIAQLRGPEGRQIPTVLSLYTDWETNDFPKLSSSKRSAYKIARERIDEIMGRRIDSLTVSEMQDLVNRKASSYYTARDIKTLLSHIYSKALPDRFVSDNLSRYIVLPELEESDAVPFTAAEVRKMWDAVAKGDRFPGYMLLMIYTGMMPGELLACRKDMIDYDRLEIWGCGKKTKRRKKEVPIVFPAFLAPVIRILASSSPSEMLVAMREKAFYAAYHEATVRIGVRDLPPYSCRHTTGTEAARLNLSAALIQKVMRHAKITTTQRYIHLGDEDTHGAVDQILPQDLKSIANA